MTAISIDWSTKIITVPQSAPEITHLTGSNYQLDTNAFHLTLRALEAAATGLPYLPTHNHNTEVTLGGITFARVIEITNGYTVTFENGTYIVNMYGSNNNIVDVANLNNVSLRADNSAGLIVAGSGVTSPDIDAIASAVWESYLAGHMTADTMGARMSAVLTKNQFLALE